MPYNYNIVLLSKSREECSDVIAFLETAFRKVVVGSNLSSLTIPYGTEFDLVIADIRNQADNGEKELQEAITAANTLYSIPVIALCKYDCIPEYTTALSYGSEIIEVPLNKEATLRRCLRAMKTKR